MFSGSIACYRKGMGRSGCIEERRKRQNLTQTLDERVFTRGNSSGNPNRKHKKLSAVEAAVSAAKFEKQRHHAAKRGSLMFGSGD